VVSPRLSSVRQSRADRTTETGLFTAVVLSGTTATHTFMNREYSMFAEANLAGVGLLLVLVTAGSIFGVWFATKLSRRI
jgi:predicted MFS family arabinose efflux permease